MSENVLARFKFNELPQRDKEKLITSQQKASMADGSGLLMYGPITLSCRISSIPQELTFLVANISEDAILGMTFFTTNQCQLNLDQGILQVKGRSLQCTDELGRQISTKI